MPLGAVRSTHKSLKLYKCQALAIPVSGPTCFSPHLSQTNFCKNGATYKFRKYVSKQKDGQLVSTHDPLKPPQLIQMQQGFEIGCLMHRVRIPTAFRRPWLKIGIQLTRLRDHGLRVLAHPTVRARAKKHGNKKLWGYLHHYSDRTRDSHFHYKCLAEWQSRGGI
jgi:hypothetical protein